MIKKIIFVSAILMVSLGGYFAIYLQKNVKISKAIRIGIIGESRSDGSTSLSYNKKVLEKLFNVLKKKDVQAIFFTGNLTLGWSKSDPSKRMAEQTAGTKATVDMYGNDWSAKGFLYNQSVFQKQLRQFSYFFDRSFGNHVAIYPLMGNHEAIGKGAASIFRDVFSIKNSTLFSEDRFGYTISLSDAFFAMIPTNYYDSINQKTVEHTISPDTLLWLDDVLKKASKTHRYLFVLGHEPAYSSQSLFNKSFGLDHNPNERDALWRVLKNNHVLAYLSSHEHLYDRSNRDGIWQVVSGGGGSPLNEGGENNNAFFHCLLLTIPAEGKADPTITVLDEDGTVRDEFTLSTKQQTLYQLRISKWFLRQFEKGAVQLTSRTTP